MAIAKDPGRGVPHAAASRNLAELEADYLDLLDKHRTAKRLIRRLDALG